MDEGTLEGQTPGGWKGRAQGTLAFFVAIMLAVSLAINLWTNIKADAARLRVLEEQGAVLAKLTVEVTAMRIEHQSIIDVQKKQQTLQEEQLYVLALPPAARPELIMPNSLKDKIRAWPNEENRRR